MIPFVKAVACGNDFLIIQESAFDGDRHQLTKRLCQRTSGIGADGVEWISAPLDGEADIVARLINADGSDAEISGNGTRCVAAYMARDDASIRQVRVQTGAGVKSCGLVSASGNAFDFTTGMGVARVEKTRALNVRGGVEGIAIDLGNPHWVMLVESLPGEWRETARQIQEQKHEFSRGVNVEFVIVEGRRSMKAFFYERGAGETQSSGTGSCAAAAGARSAGLIDDFVEVHAPGGTQIVSFRGDEIMLRGTAQIICRGEALL